MNDFVPIMSLAWQYEGIEYAMQIWARRTDLTFSDAREAVLEAERIVKEGNNAIQ